jgi:hypothetical protein
VEQSVVVDDGEAMSIAIAASRGLELAIDDKQATDHTHRAFPQLSFGPRQKCSSTGPQPLPFPPNECAKSFG